MNGERIDASRVVHRQASGFVGFPAGACLDCGDGVDRRSRRNLGKIRVRGRWAVRVNATISFLADLTAALVAATAGGALARALRITPIMGYLVAGVAIGPFSPGYIARGDTFSGLSELGLIFLLFSLGLGFSVHDLRSAGWWPMAANLGLMAFFAGVGWALARALGFAHPATLGLAFTLSSTAIGVALLQEFGLHERRIGHLALALLIVQDLVAVVLLVVTAAPATSLSLAGVTLPLVKAAAFVAIALIIGATLLHRLVITVLRRAPTDSLVGVFSAIALVAAWLGHLAGLSFEFGAFVAGAVTSEAAGGRMAQTIVAPFRELFVMIFFVSVGMLFDVKSVIEHWRAVLLLGAVLAAVRLAGWGALGRAMGWRRGAAVAFGIAMLPLGEFNIVLASAAQAAHRLDRAETASFIGVAFASILLAAVLARLAKMTTFAADAEVVASGHFHEPPDVLIIGYGRVGRTTAAILRQAGASLGVIEIERDLARLAREEGAEVIRGNGSDPRLLDQVLSSGTKLVVTTIPDSRANAAIARRISALSQARIIARASRARDVGEVQTAGALLALVPEAEGALAFAEVALGELGVDRGVIDELIARARSAPPRARG
ncbi:hypothetical protein EPN44_04750 [bacterium]|nr:MAG: hypothetical protein EPN44_04750 [bacterium]